MFIGDFLRRARLSSDLSREQVVAHITRIAVLSLFDLDKIENGHMGPSEALFKALCDLYRVGHDEAVKLIVSDSERYLRRSYNVAKTSLSEAEFISKWKYRAYMFAAVSNDLGLSRDDMAHLFKVNESTARTWINHGRGITGKYDFNYSELFKMKLGIGGKNATHNDNL